MRGTTFLGNSGLINAIAPLSVQMRRSPKCLWLNEQPWQCECGELFTLSEQYVSADEANEYIERKRMLREAEAKLREEERETQTQPQKDEWPCENCNKTLKIFCHRDQHRQSKHGDKLAQNDGAVGVCGQAAPQPRRGDG